MAKMANAGNMAFPIAFESTDNFPSYKWAVDAGEISQIPSFQRTRSDLDVLVHWESRPRIQVWPPPPYTIQFNTLDCTTTSGTRNCTQACHDGASLFTPANLRICSILAGASLLVRNDTFDFNLSDGVTRRVSEEWRVPNLTTFDGAGVLKSITRCVSRSCIAATGVGTCTENLKQLSTVAINVANMSVVVDTLGHYCDSLNSLINTDMAGPGVILSYLFQTSLALLLYILIKTFTLWPSRLFNFLGFCRASLREKGQRLQAHLASSRYSAAVISSLVEFQEVQLYFVGSIQVASFVSFSPSNPNTGSSNSNSFGSALLSSALANVLGMNSVYTVLLCQVCLQREGMHWWYIFVLMSVVFALALAIVAGGNSLMPTMTALWKKFMDDEPVPDCGENPSPMTYCGPPLDSVAGWSMGVRGRYVFALFGSLAYLGLAIDQFSYAFHGKISTVAGKLGRPNHGSKAMRFARRAWPWVRDIYWFIVEAILLLGTLLYYAILLEASPQARISDSSEWSFGQLIAVMVWAPTIVKYIYFNIFGIEDGFEERISKYHTISQNEHPSHKFEDLPEHQQDLRQTATYPLVRADGRLWSTGGQTQSQQDPSRTNSAE